MSPLPNRQLLTILLAVSGGLLLLSGLFLLFDLESHLVKMVHQWISIVFVAACAIHISRNRKPLSKALNDMTIPQKEGGMFLLQSRQFWTSLLAGSGLVLFVSGLFLLFHLKSDVIEGIHQVVGVIFIAACAAHITLNRKPLLKTLGNPITAWSLIAALSLSFLIMVFSDFESSDKHRHGHGDRHKKSHKISRSF